MTAGFRARARYIDGAVCGAGTAEVKEKRGILNMEKAKGSILVILSAVIFGFTPILAKITYSEGWGEDYFGVSKSSGDRDVLINYIKNQKEHHKNTCFEEEYRRLVEGSGRQWDDRFLT